MDLSPVPIQKIEVTLDMSLLAPKDLLPIHCYTLRAGPWRLLSLSLILQCQEQHWLQLAWLSYFIRSNLLLPRLPCSSLCFCPLNFSHCWQSPVLGLQKSGGGAYWQGCRLPVPNRMPYLFTRPEQPTCAIVHILALPSSALNKKKGGEIVFETLCIRSQGLWPKHQTCCRGVYW